MTQSPSNTTAEILVPQAPLWLLSFAADGHPLSCSFVMLSDGYSFDDAWLRARAASQVPPGRWDVTGWEVPESTRLDLLALDPDGLVGELVPGQRFTEAIAVRLFGPRSVWDWRAADGPRRRALEASLRRTQPQEEHAPCAHELDKTEECLVAHEGRGPCKLCRTCLRWVRWEDQDEQRRPAVRDLVRS